MTVCKTDLHQPPAMPMSLVKPLHCDVFVSGGGISGCFAAVSAAREGASVILCQDRSVLGGNASSEIRMHIVGADSNGYRNGFPMEVEAREGGLVEELRLRQAVENPARSPHGMDLALYEMVRNEPNITLLLDTFVKSGAAEGDRLKSVQKVVNNYQRQRVHQFAPIRVKKLRLKVNSSHGITEARVFEIRCE